MWHLKEGNFSIRPSIEVFVNASRSRGYGQPRTPPMSIIPRVAAAEVIVLECEKDGRVQGQRHGKHCEAEMWEEALTGRRMG